MRHYISSCCGAPICETYLPKQAQDTESIIFIEYPDTDICSKCKEHTSPETSLFDLAKGDTFTWNDEDYVFNKIQYYPYYTDGKLDCFAVVNRLKDNQETHITCNHTVDLITL